MLLAELHIRTLFGKVGEVRAEDNGLLVTELLADGKKSLEGSDVVLVVSIVNGCGEFDSLVDACGENEAVAAGHKLSDLVVGLLVDVAHYDLHLLGDGSSFGKGRKSNGLDAVASVNENTCCGAAEKAGAANHKYLHFVYLQFICISFFIILFISVIVKR